MGKKTVQVEVESASYDVGQAIKNLVVSIKTHLDDGLQPVADISAITEENFASLVSAVQEASQIPAEATDDIEAFLKAWNLAGCEIAAAFLKKKAALAPAPAA